ncbi:MFS general substrate transporter [Rhizodiscina lignyota]|uniref:MFS general substrate transporter n=1 Tax=Rhizodiscina lignyota TaxID=1504668 RepID=A0A9P4IPT1_9PEZI|nr:MFS general substrate transporter [Rhizodiscina lignyota]
MADPNQIQADASKDQENHTTTIEHVKDINNALTQVNTYEDDVHVHLGWRSWLVVLVTLFSNITQVYVVVAVGTVIAFIIRDLGQPGLAGWAIQGPLLMQSVLAPSVGRLSDVIGRKNLVVGLPLIAFAGACICAKSTGINMLIGGSILTGFSLSTLAIVQAIPSEVLPLKYRTIANGSAFLGGAIGGLVGGLAAGALTNQNVHGWRNTFWLQAALQLTTSLLFIVSYFPKRRSDYERLKISEYLWLMDPIGTFLFIGGTTLVLLAFDWAPDTYPYSNVHVAAPMGIGFALLVLFGLYEWKGRSDGLIAHAYFKNGYNFGLATFAFGVEGWIFFSAVNSITPQIALNLGWEDDSWRISIRQLAYQVPTIFASIPIVWYSTKYKDLKSPLIVTYVLFLVITICFATVKPSENNSEYAFLLLSGLGQAGPLTLLVALVQFTAPHAFLSTATGLAFSARAIGGAFGSAVLDAIINGHIASHLVPEVGGAAINAGLPSSSVPTLLKAFDAGTGFDAVEGLNATILAAASSQRHWTYAHAYRLGWSSIIPFVVLALVAVAVTKSVKEQMTEHVEAPVEKMPLESAKGVEGQEMNSV